MKRVCTHQNLQIFGLSNKANMNHFHPLEVVSRYREPQFHVDENVNLNDVTWLEMKIFSSLALSVIMHCTSITHKRKAQL